MRIKQRAPESKKRASDARLTQAINKFTDEEDDLIAQLEVLFRTEPSWKLLCAEDTGIIRFKVALDRSRYFVVQMRQYG